MKYWHDLSQTQEWYKTQKDVQNLFFYVQICDIDTLFPRLLAIGLVNMLATDWGSPEISPLIDVSNVFNTSIPMCFTLVIARNLCAEGFGSVFNCFFDAFLPVFSLFFIGWS